MDREDDIQKLCEAVKDSALEFEYNSNGPDGNRCVFCYRFEADNQRASNPSLFKHATDCAVLIARDLSAGKP